DEDVDRVRGAVGDVRQHGEDEAPDEVVRGEDGLRFRKTREVLDGDHAEEDEVVDRAPELPILQRVGGDLAEFAHRAGARPTAHIQPLPLSESTATSSSPAALNSSRCCSRVMYLAPKSFIGRARRKSSVCPLNVSAITIRVPPGFRTRRISARSATRSGQ